MGNHEGIICTKGNRKTSYCPLITHHEQEDVE